ncbi:MAG: hypothetical protein KF694_23280 [Mesorhizobium sp.]|nr:hypothetical protein [Mesorhizobium sp.]
MARITSSAIVRYWVRENGRGVVLSFLLFAAISTPFVLLPRYSASPVMSREEVGGTVVSVATHPINPKVAVGRGFHYEYRIRLDDGRVVSTSGPIAKPHPIGEDVILT